jgi:hypothetical protein
MLFSYTLNDSVTVNGGKWRYIGVHPSLNSWVDVRNATVGYFMKNANVRLTNCSDTLGHPFNTSLRTGTSANNVLVYDTTAKEIKQVSAGTFATNDSLHLYKKNSDSTGASGYATNNKVDTLATNIYAYAAAIVAGSGGGEVNTASNLGGGLANYDSKSGVDLQFSTLPVMY